MSVPDGGVLDDDGVSINGRDSTYLCLLAQQPGKDVVDDIINNKLSGVVQQIALCMYDGSKKYDARIVGAAQTFIDWAKNVALRARKAEVSRQQAKARKSQSKKFKSK